MTNASSGSISKSLFGRDDEVLHLLQAYQRVIDDAKEAQQHQELVLIRGASGTGKTALANSLHGVVEKDSGLFLSGKFQVSALQDPYAVFVSAVTQLVDNLLEQRRLDKSNFERICGAIQEAMGTEGRLLTNVFPSLERLIGIQQEGSNTKGTEALQRFQYLFCKLCRITSAEFPMVLFLDDLQWGDTASLELLTALLQSSKTYPQSRLLVIGAYREEGICDETKRSSRTINCAKLPFSAYLKQFHYLAESKEITQTKIHLQNLNEASTNKLAACFLDMPTEETSTLGRVLFLRCHGNPYHALQVLNNLIDQGCLHRNKNSHTWDWHEVDILTSWGSEETIDELVRRKLTLLPDLSKKALQVTACMGDEIDVCAVAMVLETSISDIELSFQAATAEAHLMCDNQNCRLRFSHDRVRQAALSMIGDKDAMSYSIGYRLWTCASPLFLNERIFTIANLLNCGKERMINQVERYKAAELNLEAGIKAASLAAFPNSSRYFKAGIEFLQGGDYWNEQYDLSLKLFSNAADTEVFEINFSSVMELVGEIMEHARTVHDTLTAQVAKINAFGQNGSIQKAIETGINVLRQLDEPLPYRATKMAILFEVVKAKLSLRGRSDYDIMMLPSMDDKSKLAAMHILNVLLPYTYQVGNTFNPLMGTRLVRLCLKYGLHKSFALGLCTLGWVLCGSDRAEGHRLGTLALTLVEKTRARELLPRVHMNFYGLIHHWKFPLRDSLEPLQQAAQIGMEIGDVEYSMIALYFKCTHSISCGLELRKVEQLLVETIGQMKMYKQANMLQVTKPTLQYVHNLTGRASDPKILLGDIVGADDVPSDEGILTVQLAFFYFGANLAFRFGDYDLAEQHAEKLRNLSYEPFALFSYVAIIQIEGLIAIARARLGLNPRKGYKLGRKAWKKLKAWAVDCPQNFLCRQMILEAELKSLRSGKSVNGHVKSLYDEAVNLAIQDGFTHEAATASELAGDYMFRQGHAHSARSYWMRAHELYMKWGASAKADQLSTLRGLDQVV